MRLINVLELELQSSVDLSLLMWSQQPLSLSSIHHIPLPLTQTSHHSAHLIPASHIPAAYEPPLKRRRVAHDPAPQASSARTRKPVAPFVPENDDSPRKIRPLLVSSA